MAASLPRRRVLVLAGCAALVAPPGAGQPTRVRRVGVAFNSDAEGARRYVDALAEGLAERGFRVGPDCILEARYAEGRNERYAPIMAELARLPVDVIVVGPNTGVAAAKAVTSTLPVVMAGTLDPVDTGLVADLAHPGGNVTGVALHSADLLAKRLELLRDLLPSAASVAYLHDPKVPGTASVRGKAERAFQAMGMRALWADVSSAADLDRALPALAAQHPDALVASPAIALWTLRRRIVEFCTRQRLPSVFAYRQYVEDGGLASYAPNLVEGFRKAGTYAARILAGAKPADLPVEQPTRFELVLNLGTARTLGLAVPASVLARADDVIR
jgi:putative ABC transport system substrate-binding protein